MKKSSYAYGPLKEIIALWSEYIYMYIYIVYCDFDFINYRILFLIKAKL